MTREDIKTINDIVHKTIYGFFDVCSDEEETPMTDKDKLLLEVNKAICNNIKDLEQEPCEDAISRKSIKQKLQEHHDFFVNAYGGFSNLPQNDKSRVDEITNCIAMVVNEPSVNPQPKTGHWIPVKWHEITDEERKENDYPKDWACYLDSEMPYDGQRILVTTKGGYVELDECYSDDGRTFSLDSGYDWVDDVIAWMPLPLPFEPQESEE